MDQTFYAVYQSNGPVYGIGETYAAAEDAAREWLDPEDETPIVRYARSGYQGEADGQMSCRPCSAALAAAVRAAGGDQHYQFDAKSGLLVLSVELVVQRICFYCGAPEGAPTPEAGLCCLGHLWYAFGKAGN